MIKTRMINWVIFFFGHVFVFFHYFFLAWTCRHLLISPLFRQFFFKATQCCLTKAEEPSLSYYLPIAEGRIFGFIPSPRVLVLCEMQSVRSRIWTRVAVSISCDDNCDGKFTRIPKPDSTFRTCEDGADWHLIPCRISPRSEFFLGHIGTGILCGGLIYG